MSNTHREFELNFAASKTEMQQLKSGPSLARIGFDDPETKDLRSVYFDTDDFALRSAGFTLRIRRDRDGWEQTIKEELGPFAATAARLESTGFVPDATPELDIIRPKRLRRRIMKALAGEVPMPLFETVVRRTRQSLRTGDGGKVEVAFDEGEVRCAGRSEKLREIEIELQSGNPASAFALARDLFAEKPLQMSRISKAERGYYLAGRASSPALLPHRSIAPDITPRLTGDQAFRRILRSCGNQVLHNIAAVRESEDIEGPHQLRVGLRRLRCALKAHRPFYEKGVFKHIETEARDLAHVIGGLRDADVITDEFVAPQARNAPCEPGFKALLETLRSRRSEIRTTVRRHLASDRVRTFQLDLFALIECDSRALPHRSRRARARREPVGARASEILDTFWHKASSIGREIENLSIAERHEMRKALKNFRYVIDFYAPIYPRKAVRRYLEQLKKLQSVFGFLNDVAVLREDLSVIGPGPEPLFWAIGYLHGSNEVRADLAWAAARAHWKALTKTAAFWSQ